MRKTFFAVLLAAVVLVVAVIAHEAWGNLRATHNAEAAETATPAESCHATATAEPPTEDPNRPRCNRDGGGAMKASKCSKCEVKCDPDTGRKNPDNRCNNYCTEQKCDCNPPCP
jgi:hypothetical protein